MAHEPTLLELQHRLETLFSLGGAPGYEERLAEAAGSLPIHGDDRLDAGERLGIYTGMIFARIRDAIAEDFPATVAALGEDAWEPLLARYLDEHPTDHPDLRLAGRHLPFFLRSREPTWIADLADLELALMESFTAAGAPLLTADDLHTRAPEAWPGLFLRAVPSLRLLTPGSACDRIRHRLLEDQSPDLEAAAPTGLCLWRRDLRVFQRRIEATELGALDRVQTGIDFASLCGWIAQQGIEQDPSAAVVGMLQRWLADALLAREP